MLVTARRNLIVGFVVCMALLQAAPVLALITFDPITWAGTPPTFAIRDGQADTISTVATGGAGDNAEYRNMHFGIPEPQFAEIDAMVTTDSTLVGNFVTEGVGGLQFDFLGYSSVANAVYFESSAGGGSTWTYAFSSADQAWDSQSVSFSSQTGWTSGESVSFLTALSAVTRIGIEVLHPDTAQTFDIGLDNWHYQEGGLAIPEPGTILMSLTALLGMFGACRRQIRDGLVSLKA